MRYVGGLASITRTLWLSMPSMASIIALLAISTFIYASVPPCAWHGQKKGVQQSKNFVAVRLNAVQNRYPADSDGTCCSHLMAGRCLAALPVTQACGSGLSSRIAYSRT